MLALGPAAPGLLHSPPTHTTPHPRPIPPHPPSQVVGVYNKAGDLKVNVCKQKALTNMRAANKEVKTALDEARVMGLDEVRHPTLWG